MIDESDVFVEDDDNEWLSEPFQKAQKAVDENNMDPDNVTQQFLYAKKHGKIPESFSTPLSDKLALQGEVDSLKTLVSRLKWIIEMYKYYSGIELDIDWKTRKVTVKEIKK